MSGLNNLQKALRTWVTIERHPDTEEVTTKEEGPLTVTTVMAYPEASAEVFADVHFMRVVPTDNFPEPEVFIDAVEAALGAGEFLEMDGTQLSGGLSYIDLGGWLGSQELALMLIGAMELTGLAKAVTPAMLGLTGEAADSLAGMGMVMMGPWDGWTKTTAGSN